MHVRFVKNRMSREVKVGFSWTVFFFGPFPFAFRGQWGWALFTAVLCFLTWGLAGMLMAFFANRITGRSLAENGWFICNPEAVPPSWNIAHPNETWRESEFFSNDR